MPAYNVEKYIVKAINSILQQSYTNFELLVCDDGSSDATLKIVSTFKDERVRVFKNETNKGNLTTTNVLLAQCKGEYITIQDADDWSFPNSIQLKVEHFLSAPQTIMLGTNYVLVSEKETEISCGLLPLRNDSIKEIMKKEVIPALYATMMIKSEVIKKVGGFRLFFNRKGYADFDWLARCAEQGVVENLPQILYVYRKHNQSFTHNYPEIFLKPYMSDLIVEAHHRRMLGKYDFFENGDEKEMKKFVSDLVLKQAESAFWNGNKQNAIHKLKTALYANPFNWSAYRSLFYIIRK